MSAIDMPKKAAGWEQFYQMIHVQFPHSIVAHIQIRGGAIFYEFVDSTTNLLREESLEGRSVPEPWDEHWCRLWRFCREVQDADLREIHFRDGSPRFFQQRTAGRLYEDVLAAPHPILGQ